MNSRADMIKTMQDFILEEPSDGYLVKGHSYTYDHYDFEKMGEFANAFDPTNDLTLLYLSDICKWQIGNTTCPMQEVLNGSPHIERYRRCLEIANSPDISFIRETMVKKLSGAVGTVTKQKLIGDGSDIEKALENAIEALFDKFAKLKFEVYLNSGKPVVRLDASSISIQACQSLAECLLRLEKSLDGIYVCYIANPGTLDGWFGFFVKSNGNMFSYNERIDEKYIGQHGRLRNGRYAENKAYNLFPYELCEFSEETDYKGYSREIKIGDHLNLAGEDGCNLGLLVRMLMSMGVIAKKHTGQIVEGNQVYVNSLLPRNMAQLEAHKDNETTALVKWESSALVESVAKFDVPLFDVDKVLRGEYDAEFDHDGKGGEYTGSFSGANQEIVDAYGAGFEIKQDKVLSSNSSLKLIGNTESEQEFVGSKQRLRLQAYYEVRKQLAHHVWKKMDADYRKFGGEKGLLEWYDKQLRANLDKILPFCVQAYDNIDAESGEGRVRIGEDEKRPGMEDSIFNPCVGHMSAYARAKKPYYAKTSLSDFVNWHYKCLLTGDKPSAFFLFRIYSYKQVERFLGISLPKFCKGWYYGGIYNGNCLLDVTDPVGNMKHPLDTGKGWFDFTLALSKRAINQMRKEVGK